ncbi:MAG: glycogen synthase [Balneolaceae bacterium]
MNIIHVSAECYPVAKAGGLGDVVGALPKYLNRTGNKASVILPHYHNKWLQEAETELVYEASAPLGKSVFSFRVSKLKSPDLGFDLYLVDIPGRFDRPGIYLDPWSGYPYWDEKERFFCFQIAALDWINQKDELPEIIHCHDHHTALIPFMMNHSYRYSDLKMIPSVITIHNGEYQGRYDFGSSVLIPDYDLSKTGVLDWDGSLNTLAAGIKSAWKVSTVSKGYLKELQNDCHGLEFLLRHESNKSIGILNGIDSEVWDPSTDNYLDENYSLRNYKVGKAKNKEKLSEHFNLDGDQPFFAFIGRLVGEKGADILPALIRECKTRGVEASFLVLGTGDPNLHTVFEQLAGEYVGYFDTRLEYNEKLAHLIYAGSDFLLMPSRVEPCGLNQLYSMRYGTVPIVRGIGGLADTVIDISAKNGYGLVFDKFDLEEAVQAVIRGVELYKNQRNFNEIRRKVMNLDFSWNKAAEKYVELYKTMIN